MPNANITILIGHVTRDPELKYLPSGLAVVDFGLAVNSGSKEKQDTLFMDCQAFDKLAETIHKYVKKGNAVYVQGRLKQDNWDDKTTGAKRSKIKLVVNQIQFLSKPTETQEREPSTGWTPPPTPDEDSDIPF